MQPNQVAPTIPPSAENSPSRGNFGVIIVITLVVLALAVGSVWWFLNRQDSSKTSAPATNKNQVPQLATQVLLDNRDRVWDMAFLPTGELMFTERKGTLSVYKDNVAKTITTISDVSPNGEGGLLGLAIDPGFEANRYLYTCFNTNTDIKVVRWQLKADQSGLEKRKDIITGIPANPSGRHSGCRLAFGPDGYLWTGTGDTAQDLTPQTPQDPKSLAGKILRTDRDGKGAPGNMGGVFDGRIYSYGHRNTQGIAFFDAPVTSAVGISVEHGSSVDDEVNPLVKGNFGWAPPDGAYDESVPMTDKARFPGAIDAIWSSGNPTQAPSGAAIVYGKEWKAWDGAIAVAVLKDRHLKFLTISGTLKLSREDRRLENEFGRLRAVRQGPDGALYISTDNGANDKILRVTPE